MNKILPLFLCISMLGCSPHENEQVSEQIRGLSNLTVYSGDEKPSAGMTFTNDANYGNSLESLIGKIGEIAVDRSGRVYIADIQKQTIHVFEPGLERIVRYRYLIDNK